MKQSREVCEEVCDVDETEAEEDRVTKAVKQTFVISVKQSQWVR